MLGRACLAAEMDHPCGELKGKFAEVFASGVALVAEEFDGLDEFDPVSGGVAERLAHVCEEGDGAGSGGFGSRDEQGSEEFGFGGIAEEGSGAGFDIEDQSVQAGGEFFAEDGGADESGGFDGTGAVAESVEDAVGGDEIGGLADDGGSRVAEDGFEFRERKCSAEAGNGFELVECSAGVAKGAPADHGHDEAAGGGDGSDEEAGFVADAAGRVLIDGGLVERARIEAYAGVAHGEGERAYFVEREAVEAGGHEPGGELFERDGFGGRAGDEEVDFCFGEGETVAGFADEVDGVHGV